MASFIKPTQQKHYTGGNLFHLYSSNVLRPGESCSVVGRSPAVSCLSTFTKLELDLPVLVQHKVEPKDWSE